MREACRPSGVGRAILGRRQSMKAKSHIHGSKLLRRQRSCLIQQASTSFIGAPGPLQPGPHQLYPGKIQRDCELREIPFLYNTNTSKKVLYIKYEKTLEWRWQKPDWYERTMWDNRSGCTCMFQQTEEVHTVLRGE